LLIAVMALAIYVYISLIAYISIYIIYSVKIVETSCNIESYYVNYD